MWPVVRARLLPVGVERGQAWSPHGLQGTSGTPMDTRHHMDGTLTGGYYDVHSNKVCADPAAANLYGTWTGLNPQDPDDSRAAQHPWASWTLRRWHNLLERAEIQIFLASVKQHCHMNQGSSGRCSCHLSLDSCGNVA